jgi:hypothetical protein
MQKTDNFPKENIMISTGTISSIYTDYPSKEVSTVDYVQSRLKPLVPDDTEGTAARCATAEDL